MERFYSIADINFRIVGQNVNMSSEDGVLTPFRTEKKQPHYIVYLESADALSLPEGACIFTGAGKKVFCSDQTHIRYEGVHSDCWEDAYMRISRCGGDSYVQLLKDTVTRGVSPKTVLTTMELEHHAVENQGFLFHSAYIRWEDFAILFTGPSGAGKSTQAELWCRLQDAELINGDRSVVRLQQGKAMVHGVPYSGSSGVSSNRSLPLRAVVRLSQAPQTTIERISGLRAFRELWEQCCVNIWNRDDVEQCMQTVMEVINQVPIYHLACTPDESAVTALEKMLKE